MPQSSTLHAPRASQLIASLQLQPHPEGGWYREVFRSTGQVAPLDGRPPRNALTSIYFLLEAGQHSCWHQVLSDEVWVHLEGAPLELWVWDAASHQACCTRIGPISPHPDPALAPSPQPQQVVAAGLWQAARPYTPAPASENFTLVACMVGPGFDFSDFRMMQAGSVEARIIHREHPGLAHLVQTSHPTHTSKES